MPTTSQSSSVIERRPAELDAPGGTADTSPSDLKRGVMALLGFCGLVAVLWCIFYALYAALPYVRSGAEVIYKAKVNLLAQGLDADTVIFGNSKVLSGFSPSRFDAAQAGIHSFNLGLPDEERFIANLETVATHGRAPRFVLLTLTRSAAERKANVFHYLDQDQMIMDRMFPFRRFPRDLTLFLLRSHAHGGPSASYQQNKAILSQMVADRGYYFIEGQSRYPGHQLPSDFHLVTDQPAVVNIREQLNARDLARLRAVAKRFQMHIWFVPLYYREGEYAVPPAANSDLAHMVRDDRRLHLAGPDYWLLPGEYFSDPSHLNHRGAEVYTSRLAELLTAKLQ